MRLIRAATAVVLFFSIQSLVSAQLPPAEPTRKQVAPVYSVEEATKVIRLQSEAILELQKRLQSLESRVTALEAQRPRSDANGKGK